MMESIPHPAWIEIDLGQFQKNLQAIRRKAPGALLCLPVKANGYGHGLVQMSLAAEKYGIDQLAVSCLKEGVQLRQAGIRCPVLVLGAIHEEQISDLIDHELEFSISSRMKAQFVEKVCRKKNRSCSVHIEVDTGMHRTGVRPETAAHLFHEMKRQECFNIRGIYSHFATADRPQDPFVYQQIERFQDLRQRLGSEGKGILWHLANSGGVYFYPESHFDMIRPGLLCYGWAPDGRADEEIRPFFSLKAKISYFKVVGANEGISYGHLYRTKNQTRVVTIPVGYGDGYSRAFSNRAQVLLRGKRHRISGRICMDQFMVDIGQDEAYVGEEATLVGGQGGEEISLWELTKLADTDPREVLCHFADRIPRIYRDVN